MMTLLIGGIGLILIIVEITNKSWGALAVTAGILLILIIASFTERQEWKAYVNRRDWWADGKEPSWMRKWKRGSGTYSTKVRDVSRREARLAAKKREAYKAELRNGARVATQEGGAHVCHYCGRMVRAAGTRVQTGTGVMVEYSCPKCGNVNRTKLGA